ncbi:CpcT/CpeT family chromophore lyase [Aliidiomarina soli]|nr:CpcT/CpeT family chromophore lyase [Aliidiomarina soli]
MFRRAAATGRATVLMTILSGLAISASAAEGDTQKLLAWFAGDFTNYQQTIHQPEQSLTPVIKRIEPLDYAEQGHAFLSEQAYLFEPDQVIRRQIYLLERVRGGWRQAVFNVETELGAAELADPSNWQASYGCEVNWRWRNGEFEGERNHQRCYFYRSSDGQKVSLSSQLRLSENALTITEQAFLATNTPLLRSDLAGTHHYARMQYYDAQVEYRAPGTDRWRQAELIGVLHNQGARVGIRLSEQQQELRYQFAVTTGGEQAEFALYDLNGMETVHQEHVAVNDVIEYQSDYLKIELTPRASRSD